jgi:hypothetical protein
LFQLAQTLSAMNPLKFGLWTPFFAITLFNFCHMTHWTFVFRLHDAYCNHHHFIVCRKDHTHGKQVPSKPPCAWHDQTWSKLFRGHRQVVFTSLNHNLYHLHA